MQNIDQVAIGALAALIIASIYSMATTAIRRRVSVRSPESVAIAKITPAVNALLEMQGPQTDALIALLEAQQGKCNGNVERALEVTTKARAEFDGFLRASARVEL